MAIFTNQATLTYNGVTTNSNVAFGELLEVLAVSKTALQDTYSPNELITYAITVRNTGSTAISGVTVTDDLGADTFGTGTVVPLTAEGASVRLLIGGVLQAAPTVTVGPPLVVSGITIPASSDAVILYQARTNSFASPETGGTIVNTATVTGTGIATPLTASETLAVSDEPELTIAKAISPAQVVDNDRVTYTFVIQNNGNTPADAGDGVVITDTFNPVLSDLAVTLDGAPFTSYTYAGGVFTTNAGAITVPAATSVQNPTTGEFTVTPGTVTLTVEGTIYKKRSFGSVF